MPPRLSGLVEFSGMGGWPGGSWFCGLPGFWDNVGYSGGVAKRKKRRRRPSTGGPTTRRPPTGPVALRKAAVGLQAAQVRYRELMVEAYEAGLSQREIAAIVGRSQPAVSKLLQRAGASRPSR